MIAGNPIPAQNGLGVAQKDPAFSGSRAWLGRTVRVLEVATCLMSVGITCAALANGFHDVAAVSGAAVVVSGLSLLSCKCHNHEELSEASLQSAPVNPDDSCTVELYSTDQSKSVAPVATHKIHISPDYTTIPVYRGASAPVAAMSPAAVNVSTNNAVGLMSMLDLYRCARALDEGITMLDLALDTMRLYSSPSSSQSFFRKQISNLETKEPFDEKKFLFLVNLLEVGQSAINDHRQLDKAAKIQWLEELAHQRKDMPLVQRQLQHAKTQIANLKNIEEDFRRSSPLLRFSSIPDPIPDNEVAQIKDHVDALEALLVNIRSCQLCFLIDAHDSLQEWLSEADNEIKKCRKIFKRD
ncbi:hypothetical protein [Endozoicomonas sp. SESOKO1]|uniref:hypothetical protein n=1 Tax=Endozoicomonas sp. SESOKO1 TaxID=2828742 RepID=UPI00214922B3|nr:hypothetical protein [Endozoicomonas sp. SESOKO1]